MRILIPDIKPSNYENLFRLSSTSRKRFSGRSFCWFTIHEHLIRRRLFSKAGNFIQKLPSSDVCVLIDYDFEWNIPESNFNVSTFRSTIHHPKRKQQHLPSVIEWMIRREIIFALDACASGRFASALVAIYDLLSNHSGWGKRSSIKPLSGI